MSDIDEKLKSLELEFLHGVPVHLNEAMIEQVKQAFEEAGYFKVINIDDVQAPDIEYDPAPEARFGEPVSLPLATDRSWRYDTTGKHPEDNLKTDLAPYYTEMIKAYIKAGGGADCVLMSRNDYEVNAKLSGLMTGQEWYDKFWAELMKTTASELAERPSLVLDKVDAAAKKAAGLND